MYKNMMYATAAVVAGPPPPPPAIMQCVIRGFRVHKRRINTTFHRAPVFYKTPLILPRATSLATVTVNGISMRGEEVHAGVPACLMFLLSSGERSPYRSAAHNATARYQFPHPFLLERERRKVMRV